MKSHSNYFWSKKQQFQHQNFDLHQTDTEKWWNYAYGVPYKRLCLTISIGWKDDIG